MMLAPFFTYFGGKYRSATRYPPPLHGTIVEPFAGSAGYALRYHTRNVVLIEKSEPIAGIWSYLIRATPAEILALPLLEPGQSVDTLNVPQEARWLIGMGIGAGLASPRKTRLRDWPGAENAPMSWWGTERRARCAENVRHIRHWRVINGSYHDAPDLHATWFVDPPYEGMGKHYPCGADDIDFGHLAEWCRSRRGQVMVCEQQGAAWLPFVPFGAFKSNPKNRAGSVRSAEALWLNEFPGAGLWLPGAGSHAP